ncbi:VOC family protein [Priestia megaterium]
MINQIDHIMLRVDNIEDSIHFYEDVLGLEILWEYDNYVGFTNGLVLHDTPKGENIISFFKVASVEETVRKLKEKNVDIILDVTSVPTGYTAAFKDDSNNTIHIVDNINIS